MVPSFGGRLEMLKKGAAGLGSAIGADVSTTGGAGTTTVLTTVGSTVGSIAGSIAAAPAAPFVLGGAALIGLGVLIVKKTKNK